jgi:hypothetical protein
MSNDVNFIRECMANGKHALAFGYARDMVRCGTATEEIVNLLHVAHAHVLIAQGDKASKLHAPSYYADAAQCAFTAGDEELHKRAAMLASKARKALWKRR